MATDPIDPKPYPRLTVRSAAEMLDKDPAEMSGMLYDQKYPDKGDRIFRTPYYQHAISGMRKFFRDGKSALMQTRVDIQGFRQPSRREHNFRVLNSFEQSGLTERKLTPLPNTRFYAIVDGVELRLSPDLQAQENGERKIIYFNCCNKEYDPETARRLVEIAFWVLRRNGVDIRPDQIEFIDLFRKETYTISDVRAKTIESLSAEAMKVTKLWNDL